MVIPLFRHPSGSTKWNVGSFDRDGQLNLTMQAIFNTDTPYRAPESRMYTGLGMIAKLPRREDADIIALLNESQQPVH
jgi:hypothetical protein